MGDVFGPIVLFGAATVVAIIAALHEKRLSPAALALVALGLAVQAAAAA